MVTEMFEPDTVELLSNSNTLVVAPSEIDTVSASTGRAEPMNFTHPVARVETVPPCRLLLLMRAVTPEPPRVMVVLPRAPTLSFSRLTQGTVLRMVTVSPSAGLMEELKAMVPAALTAAVPPVVPGTLTCAVSTLAEATRRKTRLDPCFRNWIALCSA